MPEEREVSDFVLSDGTTMPGDRVVCEACRLAYLDTVFLRLAGNTWELTCPYGHAWVVEL